MSKIFKRVKEINSGVVKTTALVGGIVSWIYGYEKYIDITEVAKDLQQRENEAKVLKNGIKVIKKNKFDE